jgi:Fe2+ transport system protein FeoA
MSATLQNASARTVHLPPAPVTDSPATTKRKGLRLNELEVGETARILKVQMADGGCRKRFAEMGLAEGMKVTVASTGDAVLLIVGGSRMGVAARCAEEIIVARIR